jgi:hypothetical protein
MGHITRGSGNDLEKNENPNTAYKKVWDEEKVVLRGKFTVRNIF